MPSAAEILANRRQTEAWIGFDPRMVVLNHADIVATPAGGRKKGETSAREPQLARLMPVGAGITAPVRQMLDGEEVTATYILEMLWNAVVERGDWFYVNGLKYEVVWVPDSVDRTYQTKCEVALRG